MSNIRNLVLPNKACVSRKRCTQLRQSNIPPYLEERVHRGSLRHKIDQLTFTFSIKTNNYDYRIVKNTGTEHILNIYYISDFDKSV